MVYVRQKGLFCFSLRSFLFAFDQLLGLYLVSPFDQLLGSRDFLCMVLRLSLTYIYCLRCCLPLNPALMIYVHICFGVAICALAFFFSSSLEQFESWNKIRSLCTAIVLWSYVLLASTTVCGSCICFVQIDHFRASTKCFLSTIVKLKKKKSLKMLFSLMFARTLKLAGHIS